MMKEFQVSVCRLTNSRVSIGMRKCVCEFSSIDGLLFYVFAVSADGRIRARYKSIWHLGYSHGIPCPEYVDKVVSGN